MKRGNIVVLAMVLVLAFASGAWALPVAGTEVFMTADADVPYTMIDADGVTYESFCLERERYFYTNHSYYVSSVGDYAIGGGYGADDGKDKVEAETKWLYAAYISGMFTGLESDYNADNGTNYTTAQMVQDAIWFLESEFLTEPDSGVVNNAQNALAMLQLVNFDDSGWDVVAVNLSGYGDADSQSQLVGVAPVPEPATLLLLGTGLLGVAGVSRKKLRKS